MNVEVLAVGTELLLGQIVNGNAAQIGQRLADAGLDHFHQSVVGDNEERIAAAISLAVSRSDALIITGGLGPTQDDLTREAMCLAAGVDLEFDEDYARALEERWRSRGRPMPESNLRQAHHPSGAATMANPKGTAPGIRMDIAGTWVFALPGVPAEMVPMLEQQVIPFLTAAAGGEGSVVVSRLLRTWGESESKVGEMLGDLYAASTNPTMAFLASSGEIKIRLTAKAADETEARALITPLEEEVRQRLGHLVFGADDDTVERVLLDLLEGHGWTIGTAESATGGMVAAALTSVPGASRVFRGAIVAYQEDLKRDLLGVGFAAIEEHGVVSEAVAKAMAEGASLELGADVAIAVTGAAGPDPHHRDVGTMVIAVRTPAGTTARTLRLPGDRERVRTYTTTSALHLARMALEDQGWDE